MSGASASGNCIVKVDPYYFRPTEVETLLGSPEKAMKNLGWKPDHFRRNGQRDGLSDLTLLSKKIK